VSTNLKTNISYLLSIHYKYMGSPSVTTDLNKFIPLKATNSINSTLDFDFTIFILYYLKSSLVV